MTYVVPSHRSLRSAFTLVELVLVIVVAAVLLGIAFAGVQVAGRMKGRTVCVGNLRNIGIAVRLYASEHKGRLPLPYSGHTPYVGNPKGLGGDPALKGFAALMPYLSDSSDKMAIFDVFRCPDNPMPVHELRESWETKANLHGSYNQYCGFGPRGLNSAFYRNSSDLINDEGRSRLLFIDVTTDPTSARLSNHRDSNGRTMGANALYTTGEVRWLPKEDLTYTVSRSGGVFLFPDPNLP